MSAATTSAPDAGARPLPAVLTAGFRPFFLAAALWAVAAIGTWLATLAGLGHVGGPLDPLAWHIHEMLYGFVAAAVGGFFLTAIPNWTGRPNVAGAPLAGLVLAWLAGRIVCLGVPPLPVPAVVAVDLVFPLALAAVAARELLLAGARKNLFLTVPVLVMAAGSLLMHLEAQGLAVPAGLGWRLGLGAIAMLVAVIGGRIVPAFTRNWLKAHGTGRVPPEAGRIDRAALLLTAGGLVAWAAAPGSRVTGFLLVAAAAALAFRVARWRGIAVGREPLLFILHAGYAWLVPGTALLGLSAFLPELTPSAGVHALAAGAAGTMIAAVMTRATRGHTGRALVADAATIILYVAIVLGAVLRVTAALIPETGLPLLVAAGVFWAAGYAVFAVRYAPMLLLPRPPKGPPPGC